MGESNKDREQLARIERDRERRTPAERLFIDYLREAREGRLLEALQGATGPRRADAGQSLVNFNIVAQSLNQNRPREARDTYDRLPSDMRTLRRQYRHLAGPAADPRAAPARRARTEAGGKPEGQLNAPGMLGFILLQV